MRLRPPVTIALATAAVGACAAAARRLVPYAIAEASMAPTLQDGDWVVAIDRPRRVAPGDVVVVMHPDRPGFELVKRVAAVGGGMVDGVQVPPGMLWLLGDAPDAGSVDSRAFGPVPITAVRARVIARYHPGIPRLIGRQRAAARR